MNYVRPWWDLATYRAVYPRFTSIKRACGECNTYFSRDPSLYIHKPRKNRARKRYTRYNAQSRCNHLGKQSIKPTYTQAVIIYAVYNILRNVYIVFSSMICGRFIRSVDKIHGDWIRAVYHTSAARQRWGLQPVQLIPLSLSRSRSIYTSLARVLPFSLSLLLGTCTLVFSPSCAATNVCVCV